MNHFYKITGAAIGSILFLLVFFLPASAQQKSSRKVTLNVRNGTLEGILQSIMKQTSVRIVYNQELVQKAPKMNFTASNEELKPLMRRLLKGSELTYVLQDDVMVVGPKEEGDEDKKKTNIITGEVVDEKGLPIPQVNVRTLGTENTFFSGPEGRFVVVLEEGASLVFSYVGLKRKVVKPAGAGDIRIEMEPDVNKMDEVVITGYQEVSKRMLAGSTYTLKAADVKQPGVPNITAMLQGKVPGLSVITNSGSPNAVPRLRIRGTSTLMGNANPIWVVDGVIRENPDSANPDNVMGISPAIKDLLVNTESSFSKASLAGNSVSGINVNDIESITFLKDASATAIYGTSAANGVIVVTTKKGLSGKPVIGYNADIGFIQKPSYTGMQLMNAKERIRFSREVYEDGLFYLGTPFPISYEGAFQDLMNRKISEPEFQEKVAGFERMNTNWFDVFFQNSINMAQNVSLSGGNEKLRYFSSVFYDRSAGSAKEDWQQRIGGRLKLNADLSTRLKVEFSLSSSFRTSNGYFSSNPLDYALKTSRTIPADSFYPTKMTTNNVTGNGTLLNYNLQNEIAESGSLVKNTEVNGLLSLNYLILPGLRANSMISAGTNHLQSESFATEHTNYIANYRGYDYGSMMPGGPEELASVLPFGGILQTDNSTNYTYNLRNSLDYNKRIFSERDQITLMVGQEIRSVRDQGFANLNPGYLRDRGESFATLPGSYLFTNPKKKNMIQNAVSAFAIASYSFADKYVLNSSIRTDASNRFGQYSNRRFLPVWSVSGLWNTVEEPWLKNNKVITALDLKMSYGFQGNVVKDVGPEMIAEILEAGSAIDPNSMQYVLALKSLPYPDLRWEKTKSYGLELHTALFNSLADFTFSYYDKRGTDIITARRIPLEYGIASMYMNSGSMRNYGYEAELKLNPIRNKDLAWNISVNIGKNNNQIREGSNASPYTVEDYLNGTAQVNGQPQGTFYVFAYKGLNPKNGEPLFNGIDEPNVDRGQPFINYLKIGGKRDPDLMGGGFTSVRYKAFTVGLAFSFSLGSQRLLNPVYGSQEQLVPMPEQNMPAVLSGRWRKPGDETFTNIPGFLMDPNQGKAFVGTIPFSRYYMYDHSDLNLVSGNFLRCRSMNLSYQLPDAWLKKAKIKTASISGTASNLFVIADKRLRGQDPEIEGVGRTALPIVPSYNLSVNLSF